MTRHYDAAIIGLGTMGSYAAVELARRGLNVAGFDQFTPPHGRGSHSGGTRIHRLAYPEGTGYVPLTQRAGEMWEQAVNAWRQLASDPDANFDKEVLIDVTKTTPREDIIG